jgi:hypothetical protein
VGEFLLEGQAALSITRREATLSARAVLMIRSSPTTSNP